MRSFTQERLGELLAESPSSTFWRHDIDVSPAAAIQMATLEADLGIDATYYIMSTSPFYTAESALELAAAVSALGHRVGLHIDPRIPGRYPPQGCAVSWHCPPPDVIWRDYDGFESAYAVKWKGRYSADSRGAFSYGDPEDLFDGDPYQVNLHPEHWFDPGSEYRIDADTYERFFHESMQVSRDRASSALPDGNARADATVDPPVASADRWQGAVGLRGATY